MSLLEQDTTRWEQVNKNVTKLKFDTGNSKKYKVEAIRDNAVGLYNRIEIRSSTRFLLPGSVEGLPWGKKYLRTIVISSAPKKLISSFYKDHPEKATTTFLPIDSAPPMARPTVKPIRSTNKQKRGQPANNASKQAKKSWIKLAYVPGEFFSSQNSAWIARISLESCFWPF